MNFPWQLVIGPVYIPWHVILETAGIFIGYRYFIYLRKKQTDDLTSTTRMWILIGAIFGSVIGSRLIGGLEDPDKLSSSSNIFFHFYLNKTILGGLLGGLACVELVKKMIGEKRSSGDLFTYPLILAMIIGRIGCFSMGIYEDVHGIPTTSILGMDLGDGLSRHPVTLYEIAFLIFLWIVLYLAEIRIQLAPGAKFKLFLIAYLIFRLMLDFIKPHYTFGIGLSTIQLTCVAGLIYYIHYIFQPKKLLAEYA